MKFFSKRPWKSLEIADLRTRYRIPKPIQLNPTILARGDILNRIKAQTIIPNKGNKTWTIIFPLLFLIK